MTDWASSPRLCKTLENTGYWGAAKMNDLRTLGYADGMAWALVWVRGEIRRIDGRRPNPRHRHKTAQHERRLVPLHDLEHRMKAAYDEAIEAFDAQKPKEAGLPEGVAEEGKD